MRGLASQLGLTHSAYQESDEEIAASALPPTLSLDSLRSRHWSKSPRARFALGQDEPTLALCQSEPPLESRPEGLLQLLTPKGQHFLNSTFANMARQQTAMGRPTLQMHPQDASARGLDDGCHVTIRGGDREIEGWLQVDSGIIPGVVALAGKWWRATGAATNTLTGSRWSEGGQPAYNDTYVSVEARTEPSAPSVSAPGLNRTALRDDAPESDRRSA